MKLLISDIERAKDRVVGMIDGNLGQHTLPADAELDTAGTQLLAAAVIAARSEGREFSLFMVPGSPPELLWKRLALEEFCRTLPPHEEAGA